MNLDQGKTDFDLEERAALVAQVREFRAQSGLNWGLLARKIDMPQGTLSSICSDGGDLMTYSNAQYSKLYKFFRSAAAEEEIASQAALVPGFQRTKTAARVHRLLDWCRTGEFVVAPGNAGIGKTTAMKQYAEDRTNSWLATISPTSNNVFGMLQQVCKALGINKEFGTQLALSRLVRAHVAGREGVLMLDEAQILNNAALEELRAIHDETGIGLFLTGNHDVMGRFGPNKPAFAQLSSRVSVRHNLVGAPEDVAMLLTAWGVDAPAERDLVGKIGLKNGGGALRQMNQVLKFATVIAKADGEPRGMVHLREAIAQFSHGAA